MTRAEWSWHRPKFSIGSMVLICWHSFGTFGLHIARFVFDVMFVYTWILVSGSFENGETTFTCNWNHFRRGLWQSSTLQVGQASFRVLQVDFWTNWSFGKVSNGLNNLWIFGFSSSFGSMLLRISGIWPKNGRGSIMEKARCVFEYRIQLIFSSDCSINCLLFHAKCHRYSCFSSVRLLRELCDWG